MPPTPKLLTAVTVAALSAATFAVTVGTSSVAAESARRVNLDRRLADNDIRESSGLARSTYYEDVLWTHNDSGDSSRIFGVRKNGRTAAVLRIAGASARDWEDMAPGPNHTLWVGDIGDNARQRGNISVYRITEPRNLESGSVRATRFDLKYPDRAHDAEGLMVRPGTGRVFVISKSPSGGAIYRAPRNLSTSQVNKLRKVRSAPERITAAAWRPGGGFVLTSQTRAYVYPRKKNSTPRVFVKPELRQGESVEFSRNGSSILVGSEGSNSPVYRMRVN